MRYTENLSVEDWFGLEYHPLCLAIPEMSDDAYEQLRDDIHGRGLEDPITLYEGMILILVFVSSIHFILLLKPRFQEFRGPGSAYDFVIARNLNRRDLDPEQKLQTLVDLIEIMRVRAKERQQKAGEQFGRGHPGKLEANLPQPGESRVVAAELAENIGVSERAKERQRKGGEEHGHGHPGKLWANLPKALGDEKVVEFPGDTTNVEIAAKGVAAEISKNVGVSERTAKDAIYIHDHGTREDMEDVASGKMAVSAKRKEIQNRNAGAADRPEAGQVITLEQWKGLDEEDQRAALTVTGEKGFNKQQNESIGWARWSWNPVTGCKHNCPYCYARDIANRFYPHGFEPAIIPARLTAPRNSRPRASKNPAARNVFTCSMADLFGRWVPEEWIDAVFTAVERAPEWNFLFLTKFPKRMIDRAVPENVWLGTSVDLQARIPAVEDAFERVSAHTNWLSIEPLIEPLSFSRPELFKWVVIGGASKSSETPAWEPPFEWVARLYLQFKEAGAAVYLKDNVGFGGRRRPQEFPWSDPELESAPDVFHYLKG